MLGAIRKGLDKVKGLLRQPLHSNYFAALVHFPVFGGLATLLSMPYFIGKRATLEERLKLGVTAQLALPGIFAAGSLARYFVWLFELDFPSQLLGYALALYMVAGYALMTYNSYRLATGKEPDYKWLHGFLRGASTLIFS